MGWVCSFSDTALFRYAQIGYEYTRETLYWSTRLILRIVLLFPLCSFRDMPSPVWIEWKTTRSGLMLARWSFRAETENWIAVIRYVGKTLAKGYLPVTLYSQIYNYVIPPFERMWCIQRARYLQGHRSEVKDSWRMVCNMCLFFWLVILRLVERSWRRRQSGELRGNWHLPLQKPTSTTVNCFVHVACLRVLSWR